MGMYDTINGEQVKCFPWVSLYNNEIIYHGGDLAYYGVGSEVPYKRPHYNYGKNFIILDLNRFPDNAYCDYDYILHIIVDGKVEETFKDEIRNIDWFINETVVGYRGELLNIKSSKDVLDYIKAQREYWERYENINNHWNELFSESIQYFTGLGLLDKDSEESKFRRKKIDKIHILMEKEKERIKPKIDVLTEGHSKWFVDTSNIDDLINLGDYISAYYTELKAERKDNVKACNEMISKLLESDDTLYDRYLKWQEIEELEHIK